jgi:hypothetical protein
VAFYKITDSGRPQDVRIGDNSIERPAAGLQSRCLSCRDGRTADGRVTFERSTPECLLKNAPTGPDHRRYFRTVLARFDRKLEPLDGRVFTNSTASCTHARTARSSSAPAATRIEPEPVNSVRAL